MIYELRTYTLKPGTQPTVLGLFETALPHRVARSPLGGFWYTEIGPLNQIVHLWPYESLSHRAEVRNGPGGRRDLATAHPRARRRHAVRRHRALRHRAAGRGRTAGDRSTSSVATRSSRGRRDR